MNSSYENSSYKNACNFGEILSAITWTINPKRIVEFGILEGYSLNAFINSSGTECQIEAFDIFEEFQGNGAKESIKEKYKENTNVKIARGDYYLMPSAFENKSIDILHIDIANDGNVYKYAIENYLPKVTQDGVMILEGGSLERDQVHWMKKYNKAPIKSYLEEIKKDKDIRVHTIESFPSLTLIKKVIAKKI